MTDEEIVAMMSDAVASSEEEEGDSEEENQIDTDKSSETVLVSLQQTSNAIDMLKCFFEQNELATDDDIQHLPIIIKLCTDYFHLSSQIKVSASHLIFCQD